MGKERWGIKAVTVPGSGKKLDNPHIPVAVIDGDWLTVGWTVSDPEAEVKSDFDETMTVLEDDRFREETVALGLDDTVTKHKEI